MVGAVQVQPGSELDGIRMFQLSTQTRVIAIGRDDAPLRLHPRRDTQLIAGGDTAYLVGPYRELIATLRKGGTRVAAGNDQWPNTGRLITYSLLMTQSGESLTRRDDIRRRLGERYRRLAESRRLSPFTAVVSRFTEIDGGTQAPWCPPSCSPR